MDFDPRDPKGDLTSRAPGTPLFTAPECCSGEVRTPHLRPAACFSFASSLLRAEVCCDFPCDERHGNVGPQPYAPAAECRPVSFGICVQVFSGRAADMWSLGVTVYAMAFGSVPFFGATPYEIYERVSPSPFL